MAHLALGKLATQVTETAPILPFLYRATVSLSNGAYLAFSLPCNRVLVLDANLTNSNTDKGRAHLLDRYVQLDIIKGNASEIYAVWKHNIPVHHSHYRHHTHDHTSSSSSLPSLSSLSSSLSSIIIIYHYYHHHHLGCWSLVSDRLDLSSTKALSASSSADPTKNLAFH